MTSILMLMLLAAADPVVGSWATGGDSLALYSTQGDCPQGLKRAVYELRPPASYQVKGCYLIHDDFVYLIFEDGDRLRMPVKSVKWERGHGPATL
jgi:hypothetical protein